MIKIDNQGWLTNTVTCLSPNFNQRPNNTDISLLVIHNISLPAGQFDTGYISQLFSNTLDCNVHPTFGDLAGLTVSAHCMISRQGVITQYVSFNDRAWHAGVSSYKGIENCNDYSIGIELEGTDDIPYTDVQYQSLVQLSELIMNGYSIEKKDIVGHCDIAPGRKTDPGQAFSWSGYFSMLAEK